MVDGDQTTGFDSVDKSDEVFDNDEVDDFNKVNGDTRLMIKARTAWL